VSVYDLDGSGPARQLTFDGTSSRPVWTPDGERIVFGGTIGGKSGLYSQRQDGSGSMDLLVRPDDPQAGFQPEAWSRDGKTLWLSSSIGGQRRLMTFRPGVDSSPVEFAPVWSSNSALSPDGKWVAFMSAALGALQDIWIRPVEASDQTRYRLTTGGASDPVWAPDGKSLYYVVNRDTPQAQLMSVPVQADTAFKAGPPVPLPIKGLLGNGARIYDVAPNGGSFVIVLPYVADSASVSREVDVVLNWFEELAKSVQSAR